MALKHADRHYPFEFPINVPFFYMNTLVGKLTAPQEGRPRGFWPSLPHDLGVKINTAVTGGHGMSITQADLDPIEDKDWDDALRVLKR
jgi:hypothetical protein